MKIVADNSERDLMRRRLTERLHWTIRDFTANLLRVVRGAGRPHQIEGQFVALVELFERHRAAVPGAAIGHEFTRALSWRSDVAWVGEGRELDDRESLARDEIIAGALQIVASRLLGQTTQQAAGERELYHGFNEISAVRTERRKALAAEFARTRARSRRAPT